MTRAILPPPRPYQRAARSGRRTYTPPEQAAWSALAIPALRHAAPSPRLVGPIEVHITAIHPRPKALRKGPRQLVPSARMDLDNIAKLVLDTVTESGAWWGDDREVAVLHAEAWYAASGEDAHVEVSARVCAVAPKTKAVARRWRVARFRGRL